MTQIEKIVDVLLKETVSLKEQYLQKTEHWAANEFNHLRAWAADYRAGKFGFAEASKKYYKLPYYITNSNGTVQQHVERRLKEATEHYENSIEKLAHRIVKKELNIDNLQVRTSHIGVNIESILTDGAKTVKAFTIIAEGEIQRPHYRYLIK